MVTPCGDFILRSPRGTALMTRIRLTVSKEGSSFLGDVVAGDWLIIILVPVLHMAQEKSLSFEIIISAWERFYGASAAIQGDLRGLRK